MTPNIPCQTSLVCFSGLDHCHRKVDPGPLQSSTAAIPEVEKVMFQVIWISSPAEQHSPIQTPEYASQGRKQGVADAVVCSLLLPLCFSWLTTGSCPTCETLCSLQWPAGAQLLLCEVADLHIPLRPLWLKKNPMADSEPLGAIRPHWHLLLSCLLGNLVMAMTHRYHTNVVAMTCQ